MAKAKAAEAVAEVLATAGCDVEAVRAEALANAASAAAVKAEVFSEPKLTRVTEARLSSGTIVSPMITRSVLVVGQEGIQALAEGPHGLIVTVEFRDHTQKTYVVPFGQVQSYRIEE